ncbi:MAG TPA: MlaD family protein [Candidatus Polarisedimenticolia bacterium]|jgi:phospholipid/cholesterol/gamma-HCH transport system substrate-binding protein|nr:MlaD family protein [Candidatus Polarisedimenticolia bacterium]
MFRTREASVGFTLFAAGLVLMVGILAVGKESRLFARKVEYWTSFPNVSGLAEGSPVKLIGVQVGTVSGVEFPSSLLEKDIRITLQVDRAYASRIREGTQAHLKSLSYVSQERYIELTPGDPERPQLPPGTRIEPGVSGLAELTEMGRGIADDVKDITSQLRELLIALNQGGGVLSEMIKNPEFGRDSLEGVQKTLDSVQRIATQVEKGQGLAGTLISDREYARRQLSAIEESLQHVRGILEKVESGQGAMGQMLASGGKGDQALDNVVAATQDLKSVVAQLKSGKGMAGRMLSDDASAKRILENLDKTTKNLESITRKMDRGVGTVGGLLNDPEVYLGLKDVVAGVRKSRLGKGMIHHYQKKGSKESQDQPEEPEEEAPPPEKNP